MNARASEFATNPNAGSMDSVIAGETPRERAEIGRIPPTKNTRKVSSNRWLHQRKGEVAPQGVPSAYR